MIAPAPGCSPIITGNLEGWSCGRKAGKREEIMRDECNSETKINKTDLKNVT
jgi:hypothetical protein